MTLGFAAATPDFAFLAMDDSLDRFPEADAVQMKLWHAGRLGWVGMAGSPGSGLAALSCLFVFQSTKHATLLAYERDLKPIADLVRSVWECQRGAFEQQTGGDPNPETVVVLVGPHGDGFTWWLHMHLDAREKDPAVTVKSGKVEYQISNYTAAICVGDDAYRAEAEDELRASLSSPEEAVAAASDLIRDRAQSTDSVSPSGHIALWAGGRWKLLRLPREGQPLDMGEPFGV